MRSIYWLLVGLVPVMFLALMYFVDRGPAVDPRLVHPVVSSLPGTWDQPPDFHSPGVQEQELPDWEMRANTRDPSSIWYQFEFERPESVRGTWGVLLPWARGNFAIYLNREFIGQSAPMVRPYAEFRTPMFFEFPSSMLRPGANTIQLHAVGERMGSWMAPISLGPSEDLRPAFDHLHFVQVSLKGASVVALIVISILLAGLFWIRPADTGHGWFAGATLSWAIYNWLMIEPRVLLPMPALWFSLPAIALGWFTIFSAFFVNRLPGCRMPPRWVERSLLAFGLAGSVALIIHNTMIVSPSWVQHSLWFPGMLLISGFIVWQLFTATLRKPNFEVRLWLMASVLALVVGIRDYLWDQDLVESGSFHYLSYTVSFVLIALALTLLSRVSRALTETETLNRELEDRVAAKGAELAHNFERLQNLERQRTISAERERMTADMHDGIGGQLVHALAVIESNRDFEPLEPILRGALDDLRLIIDSADPMEGDLLVVLSNFRARNERRVQAGGLRFLWQVTDLPPMPGFGPHKILQVLRILQEALTNVLKHARATAVTVRTDSTVDDGGRAIVIVDVIDDGSGFVAGNVSGRGLGNMRRRAQELGGSVELAATEKGSRLRLILPVA